MKKRISIVVVNYNTTKFVNEIELFCDKNHIELIVVDNSINFEPCSNSTILISPRENLGFGRACNLGASYATGDVFLFQNPDTVVNIETINTLLIHNIDGNTIWGPAIPDIDGRISVLKPTNKKVFLYKRISVLFDNTLPNRLSTLFVSGAFLLINRSRFEALGGFDENIFLYAEDLDLCTRNVELGGVNAIITESAINHVGGESSKTRVALYGKLNRLKKSIDGHYRFLRKKNGIVISFFNAVYLASGFRVNN